MSDNEQTGVELTDEERAQLAELDEQLEKFEGQKRWSDVIKTVLAKAELHRDPDEKVRLYKEAGTLYVERSSNQAEAIKCFEQVLELAPEDLEAIERLKEMYEKRRDWESLIAVMGREAEMLDPADRAIRYVEMADLATQRIRKPEACIALWEKVRSYEPHHPQALEALSQLYERAREWEPLAQILETVVEADPDPKNLQKLGMIYGDKLNDDAGAVRAFKKLLVIDPDDRRAQEQLKRRYTTLKAWDELEEFYAESDKWDELIRIFERAAEEKEASDDEKIDLLFRAARLWTEKKDQPPRAARAYEKILEIDADNLRAAEALSPIYEEANDARKLAPVYEVRLRHDMEPEARVALLRELGLLYEERLRQADVALDRYLDAFATMPQQEIVREDVDRLAAATGAWDKVIEAYGTAIEGATTEDDAIELRISFGGVLRKVDKIDEAIAQFRAVYEARGDHAEAIAALAELYAATERFEELLGIYDTRMELEPDAGTRRGIAYQRAALIEEKLADADRAIDAYAAILAEYGEDETDAFRSLDRLYEGQSRWQDLADTLERRIDLGPESTEELAALKFRLARALEQHLGDKPRAVDLYREVLTLLPEHDGARLALEALLDDAEVAVAAARILEPIYEMQGSHAPLIRALRVLHDGSSDADERLELLTKIAEVQGGLEDNDAAFAAYAEALSEQPGSADTLQRLETLAITDGRFPQLVALLAKLAADVTDVELRRALWLKTAQLQEAQLEDVDGAVGSYRKILEEDAGDLEALLALDALFRRTERWADLVVVLRSRADQASDPEEKEELLAQTAAIYDEYLEDPATAIGVYNEILELDPASPRALGALDDLFGRQGMWAELADNVSRQLELADDEDQQIRLMLRLASLRETRMEAVEVAIEIYRDVLLREPTNPEAQANLERLLAVDAHQLVIAEILEPIYRDAGEVPKLIGVHEIQARLASSPERRVELLHRIAELYEVALDDYPNAFESFARALAEDPANLATQEQLERLAPAVGDLEALAKVYEERVEGLEDPALAALLLVKAAQIREEQLQDFEQAIAHYQRVLSLDDQHLEAATALERLYQLNERWEELATIYLTKARMMPTVEERKEHLHRAAQIYEELLERPTDSITVYHMALEADPEDLPSLDKLIELNLRLERWEDLLGVYTRKADIVADPDEKKRLYAEVGTVWERELNDHAKAIDSYQRILEIDPDDLAALGRLDQLYQATSAWRELLSVLEREADLSGDPLEVISFRFRIGNLYHRRLDDAERAIDIYRDVLEVAPDHAPTLDELEAMIAEGVEPVAAAGVLEPVYQQLGESAKLVNVHEVQIAHEADPLRKVELLHRVAELREIHLDDAAKAFDAYARSLPFDNGNEHTLGSLERLADQVDGWQRVTSLYDVEIRALREERPEDAIELAMRTAMLYEVQVGDVEAAINRYRLVVELDSMHVEAIEALDRLYEATERWAELADILDKEIQVAASPDDILTLQFRLGRLHQERLGQVEQAIERYADILGAAPEHQPAIQALEGLFSQGVEPLRIGEVLEPLYRMRESWDRLIGVHEVQLHYQGDQTERVSMMHRIAEIAEERAGDYDKAFFWMQRALLEDPSHDHSLMEVERLGAAQDGWEQLASTYADGIGLAAEPAHKLVLGKRLARVYEEELADVPRAEETYRYLLGVSDRDEDTLVALDRIYDENGANEALAQVLKKRIQATEMPQDLVDLHYRLGQVLENDLGRTEEAISVYQRVLGELEPEHAESVSALQEIYTRQKNWPALQAAFQKELDVVLGDTQRADIYAKMARLASDALSDFERAIELWREVLELRGEDPEALNALGNIFAQQERWAELVEVLEREANAVEHDEQRVAIYADLGRIWYERLGRERSALDSWERVLDLDPSNTDALFHIAEIHRASGQHHDLVDTLHRVVEVGAATLDDATIENVYMQLGHLYNVELQQPLDAAEAYTKAIDVNPRAFDAMDALEHIYRTESMWEDAVGVMEKRVLAFDEPERKIGQLLTIAKTWAEQLANADGGTSAFQRILELEPLHEYAFERVEALHRAAGRWDELIDAYVVRVESVEDLDVSVKLLRKTAKVYEEKLGDLDQAFDALQVAWSLDYGNDKTLEELTRVTRSAGKWNELLTAANEALQEAEDQDTKIILCLQCAKWYGQELDHPDYALPYYQQVQAVDPGNVHLMVSMAELYEKTQQWDALAQTYGQIVSTSEEPKITADTYVKMGELSSTHLGMPEQAPGYYEKAIDVVATHLPALVHLERIYSERGQWQKLLDVMQRKVRGLEEPDEIIEAQLKLAELYEDRIGNVEEAITTYSAVRSRDALNLQALKGLERLYARAERWQELLEVLQVQYDVVSTEKERITILTQLAGMWEESFIKPDRAAECHERILEIDHTHEGALNALARLYRQMQQWERLVDTYERHVAATPDRGEKVRVLKALGDTFARDLDQQDRAVDSYLNVLSINDQDVEALDALTRIYDKRGDHVSALEMMEQLARLVQDPAKQVDLLFRSARILDQELGDRMSALDKYQMALDLDPGHLPSLGAMRAIQLDSGDWLAAAKLLEQEASYQKSPRVVAELLVELGQLYEERLDEHERAVQVWEAALKQDPDNEDAALPLVVEYRRTERYAEAFPLLEMLVKRSGKREPHEQHRLAFELGETASKLAKHEEAIKAFERAYQIDATHLPTVFGVANAYFAAAQWDKAFKFYQMILLHQKDILGDAENTDIYYRQGVIKREQGERRKALNLFDKALEFDAHHRPTLEAIVGLYQQSNDWQQVVHFKKIILESVYDEDERFSMLDDVGTLWEEKLANPQKAIECWVEASTLKPEDHRLLHKLLGAYQKTRDWEKTIETIEMISSLDERKTVRSKYAYTIGVILRDELKDADRALEKFSEALDLDVDQLKAFEAVNKILNARKDWKQLERAYRKMIHRVIGLEGREDLKYNLFYTLGIIYRDRQRNFEAAAEAFKTAASLKPDDPQQHQILAELYQAIPDKLDLAISEHQWLLQHDPYRVDSYRALYKLYFDARAYDKAWCLAATLAFLQKADAEQTQFYQQYKPQGPIRPRGRVERNLWFSELLHPGQDRYVTKIMELMAPPALAVKHASDKALKIDKLKPVDPASSTALFARTWGFVLQVLNIPTQPRLYLQQQAPGGLAHLPGSNPPAVISGSTLLSGYSPQDLMFVIGRFSTYYLTEHFVRTLFGSHTELRFLLLAALRLSGLGPADPQVDQWAQPLAGHMSPAQTDALRAVCRKFIDDQGGRADIKGWMQSVELSAIRAGFLVCNDLDVARRMIQALPPEGSVDLPPKDKLKELVLFSVSEQYFKLREALGIQIQV